jgi:Ca-activated chloride channel family protein
VPEPQELYTTRMLVIFDASRSMLASWGTSTRWTEAKKILAELVDSVNTISTVETALRVYGHQTVQMENDCFDSKLEVPFRTQNAQRFKNTITYLRPQGVTPIAYSLEESIKDFGEVKPNQRNVIVLITDGAESCGSNPCEVFRQLREKGVVMKSYVIGMGIDEDDFSQLECMGEFMNIENPSGVDAILEMTLKKVFNSTTVRVDLMDSKQKAVETDVLMSFYDSESNKAMYQIYHTINPSGQPDTLAIDPAYIYNIQMHTYPPVWKNNVSLKPFVYNVVEKETPQGQLEVAVRGDTYKRKINCIVTRNDAWVHVQGNGESVKYLLGEYKLEILTLPVIIAEGVRVEQNKTTTIEIPAPGTATFQKATELYGGVYMPEGDQWIEIYELTNDNLRETLALQPGTYKVIYRFKNSNDMASTVEKIFEVNSGVSITVKL